MASNVKQSKKKIQSKNSRLPIIAAACSSLLAVILNKGLFFTDIRGFYEMHFSDGLHVWPFSFHELTGYPTLLHPIEYPAITGFIMWFLTFFVTPNRNAVFQYFWLTATLNALLFTVTTHILLKLNVRKLLAFCFALSPAVLYSLNRNWDIWAVVTMVWAIHLFEKRKSELSAVVLAISIATKFFPLVLLLPIAIQCFKQKESKRFFKYLGITVATWVVVNLPFALINFRGWSYFYEFNYKRGLGSASIYEIVGKIGSSHTFTNFSFYALNVLIFGIVTAYFFHSKSYVPLSEAAFFTMFAFILFNKQYSMQYIIWLTALAVLALSRLNRKHQRTAIIHFIIWQFFELLFQYTYFQNILTNTYAASNTPASPAISDQVYGVIGGIRYLVAVGFFAILGYFLFFEKRQSSALSYD